jgi:hypothetical protein
MVEALIQLGVCMNPRARSLVLQGAAGLAVLLLTSAVPAVLAQAQPAAGGAAAPGPAPLVPQKVLLESLEIQVPKDFVKMPPDVVKKTYAPERTPNVVFMSPDAAVTVGVTHSLTRVSAADMANARASAVREMKTAYPKAEWVKETSNPIGRGGGYLLDLKINQGSPQAKRLMIVGTSLSGRLATIVFSAPLKDEAKWAPTMEQMVKGIKAL